MGEELKEKLFNKKEEGWKYLKEGQKRKFIRFQMAIWNF